MPGKIISFGQFALTPDNGVFAAEISEMTPAQRTLTTIADAGFRGIKVLRSLDGAKIMVVKGVISKSSEAEFIAAVRAFNKSIMAEGANVVPSQTLQYQSSDGTFIYEDVVVQDTDKIFGIEEPYNQTWMPFEVHFLSPKGFARSTTQTTVTYADLTSSPYNGQINIDGTANPEPVIILKFKTHNGITGFTFINTTTNESISCSGLTIVDGDVFTIDTNEKTITQNTTIIKYSGVMPMFIAGVNNFTINFSGNSSVAASQTNYDGARNVYGLNWLAQSFELGSPVNVPQISLMLKRIFEDAYVLYDDTGGSSVDPSLWATTGSVSEGSGSIKIGVEPNSGSNAILQSIATSATGWKFNLSVGKRGSAGNAESFFELRNGDGSKRITMFHATDVAQQYITTTGFDGSFTSRFSEVGSFEVVQVGSDIQIYAGGILQLTLAGQTLPAMKVYALANQSTNQEIYISSIYQKNDPMANSDLTIRIETDSGGHPSGTIVTNGSTTIPAASVGTDSFSEIIAQFASSVSLSSSILYHLVIKQSGGDINNYYAVKVYSLGGYANGNSETTPDGITWTQQSGEDLFFRVYSPSPTGITIGFQFAYFPSHYSVV